VVLTGGVGGSKLVLGLTHVVAPESIVAIVNTGDDFRHLGFWICPDLDTLLYTLSGKANAKQGWGREDETWRFMEALRTLGGEDWFSLGDGDVALHALRSARLSDGLPLSRITQAFAQAWGVRTVILPMSDDSVSTHLTTDEGELSFQRYFVERRCFPRVIGIQFEGATTAKATDGAVAAIKASTTRAVLIAPSNPFLSIDPILALPEIRAALRDTKVPVVAVSPLIAGQAVKGPTAKLMLELGLPVSAAAIANHYADILDGMLIDERDTDGEFRIATARADTLMVSLEDRVRVAVAAVALADCISQSAAYK
jgi:LPPG:FO 2-phospho-L-lactate transferase